MAVARALRFPLLVLALHAYLFPWLPGLRSPNELSRLYQARAIVEDGTLDLNAQLARHGPVGDLSVRNGRYYPNKAPGVSFLGAGVYAAARWVNGGRELGEGAAMFWLRLACCMVPGVVAAELLRRILAQRFGFDDGVATAGATTFALGTIMWPYSTLLMSHGPTAAAVVACWWAVEGGLRARDGEPSVRPSTLWWLLAGLAAALAVLLEYTTALALPPLALYAVLRIRAQRHPIAPPIAASLLGALPSLVALAAYHQAAFGSPWATGYRFLVNPTFTQWHARGFMGVGAPSLRALLGSFLDPARGLFTWSPFLALGVPGLWLLARRDRPLALLCAAELALYALFTASFTYQAWGWSVGPRHITTLCAFLIPPALAASAWLRDRRLGVIPAGLALASIGAVAATVAVCPYLPEELTNPLHQLLLPLARAGLHSRDLLGLALGTHSTWTLLPWVALLVLASLAAARTLVRAPEPTPTPPLRTALRLLSALALAGAILAAGGLRGGPDHFGPTTAFMAREMRSGGR